MANFQEELIMKERIKLSALFISGIFALICLFVSCSGTTGSSNPDSSSDDITYYTVTFNSDGGSSVASKKVESGKTVAKPDNPTKTDYEFEGWFIEDTEYNFSSPVTSNITLKAKWGKKNNYSNEEWINQLPDTTNNIILYSSDNYIQKITDFSCSSENQTINIYVLGQINSSSLTTISQGIASLTEAYYNKTNQISKPSFNICLDLSNTTGLSKLSSNCIKLGNNGYDDSLNITINFPNDIAYISPDAFINPKIIKQIVIENKAYSINTSQTGIIKIYDDQNRNVAIFNNTAGLTASDNGVVVIFNKDEMSLSETSGMSAQLESENKTLYFKYSAKDFYDDLAQYFIPFSKAGETFCVFYNPDANSNSNNIKSISIDALGGNGFPVKQTFYDLKLSLSYNPDDNTFYVSHNTTANSFSDFFTTPQLLKHSNIHYDFYLDNYRYAYNDIGFNPASTGGTYQEKEGKSITVENIISYLKTHAIKSITKDSSVSVSDYINRNCSVSLNFNFTLDDSNKTEFYIEPDIFAACTVTGQTIDPASGLTITAADISKIAYITASTTVKAKGAFSTDDMSRLGTSLYYLNQSHPEISIALDLSEVTGVSEIEERTFANCSNINSIVIPVCITSYGYHCFEACTNLKKVYYKGTLEQWCKMTFYGWSNPCCNEADLYFNNELVTEITIPDSITSLGNYAFSSCTSLKKVIFPETTQVQSIGESAFSCCFNLTSINLPDTITSIEKYTFYQCKSLQRMNIPKNATSIKALAFKSCENLKRVSFKNMEGWEIGNEIISVNNAYTAAEYLRNTYVSQDWKRDPITSFSLKDSSVTISFDKTYQIELTANPADYIIPMDKVTFTSSKSNVIVSDTGEISYVGSGTAIETANITVSVGKHTQTMYITFLEPVTKISLDKSLIIVKKDSENFSLSATVLPENASDKTITWRSNDTNICTVENGTITVKNPGRTTITATAGDKKTSAAVLVINNSDSYTYNPETLTLLSNEGEYTGYSTDSAQKIAYAYTTKSHKSITGIPANTGKLDIIAKKGNSWKATTYNNAGWAYKINDTFVSLDSTGKASSGNLALQVVPLLINDNGTPCVLLVHALTNTGDTTIYSQKFGAGTDIEIAANDYVPVKYDMGEVSIFDDESGIIFTLNCLSGASVTPASSLWIGSCNDSVMNNIYSNKTASINNQDSALAYSWKSITLGAGETKIFTVLLSFTEDEGGALETIIY